MSFFGLSQNFFRSSQNSLRSFPGVPTGFLRIFHKFLIAFSKLSQDFLRSSSGICQKFPERSLHVSTALFFFKAFSEHSKDFLKTFKDFLWTSSRLWSWSLIFTDSAPPCPSQSSSHHVCPSRGVSVCPSVVFHCGPQIT